jgi:hypothetical protein
MPIYRERLLPGPWVFIFTGLVIPASLLVFLPINQSIGVVVAIVLYLGCAALLFVGSPIVEVTTSAFVAGRARLPIPNVGKATGFVGREATAERGVRLDARAWLVIRGWIQPVVKVVVEDPTDPAPYWLVTTRHPKELIAALAKAAETANARS